MGSSRAGKPLSGPRVRVGAAIAGAALAIGGVIAPVAGARSQSLHLYQVSGPAKFRNAKGDPINLDPPATLPVAGDSFDEVDLDYAGRSSHHAKHWTVSDHVACTFNNPHTATCDVQIAIGGSMLLGNDVTFNFGPSARSVFVLNGGTGIYAGAHGTVTTVQLPDGNSNFVIRLS